MNLTHKQDFDILALDATDKPVLAVEVKGSAIDNPDVIAYGMLQRLDRGAVNLFVMLVDPVSVRIYGHDSAAENRQLASFPSTEVFTFYDPDSSRRLGREHDYFGSLDQYMKTLVEAWIHDLEYGWKSESPPFLSQLERVGLAELLRGGTTLTASRSVA